MTQVAVAQQLPLDFENNQFPFVGFSGTSFSFRSDPVSSSNRVGQFLNNGADENQGFFIDLSAAADLSSEQNFTLRFYAFDSNQHSILLKLENGNQEAAEVIQQVAGNANSWTEVNFDFSNARSSTTGAPVSITGQYNRVTIFIDIGVRSSGTFLIDDIDNGADGVANDPIDVIYDRLVWSDEFDSPSGSKEAINDANWFHQTRFPDGNSWFNGEVQHYTNRIDNSFVEDGFLNIVAKRENFRDQNQNRNFTSARLNSKFAFTYGRVDVRARLPLGDGTWPAIWTLGQDVNENGGYWDEEFGTINWPGSGEIDIMEHGLGEVNETSSALHSPCAGCFGNTRNTRSQFISNVAGEFHIYSLNWSPDQITFLVDDIPFYTYRPAVQDDATWPFDKNHYLLLNVAIGGIAGPIDPNFDQSAMVIDYVRVFQQSTASVDDNQLLDFQIFPNPASDVVTIKSNNPVDSIQLYSIQGSQIEISMVNDTSFSVNDLASGIYVLKIASGSSISTKKLVVQ